MMVIAAVVIWIVGFIFTMIFGGVVIVDCELHREEPFEEYYQSWGGVRFYSLVFLALLIATSVWPITLVTIYIVALIRKW